jgi:hypothetical protein
MPLVTVEEDSMARSFTAAIVATIGICVAGLAMAQGGPPPTELGRGMWGDGPSWGMGHRGMGMWGHRRGGRVADWMLERIEGRLAYTKTELKITDAQDAAWNQLADAIRTAAKRHNERMKNIIGGSKRSKTLLERVEAQEQFMSLRVEEIKLIKTALNNLYAVLSEEQKKEADEIDIPMVGMMGGPWG